MTVGGKNAYMAGAVIIFIKWITFYKESPQELYTERFIYISDFKNDHKLFCVGKRDQTTQK